MSDAFAPKVVAQPVAHPVHKIAHALSQSNAAFLRLAIPAAQASETETGAPTSVTVAQACIESGWGRHHIGIALNYFGIQAQKLHHHGNRDLGHVAVGYVIAQSHEYNKDHVLVPATEYFRRYASMTDSFRDHGYFLRDNHRYRPALQRYATSGNADQFAEDLQAAGYAGKHNLKYAEALKRLMTAHKLYPNNLWSQKST